ncbi:hypothetical protein [Nostoc sp. DedQUE09]|uniref:hypothetical protein n=1 Tax=Nostoc sp. DedQUE09 TaxID=3075394 RepID=UPI002AD3CEB3|nr:hypothetical protein [Nostoc sp. DedQUE09]MDZ7950135.1 hypothetical protein [Nostoc sp. DedQUE09]
MVKGNPITQTRVRLWTINEYHRMFETGIITEDKILLTQQQRCVRLTTSSGCYQKLP